REPAPPNVLHTKRPEPPPLAALMDAMPRRPASTSAEREFVEASSLDDGDPVDPDEALARYRKALEFDPDLVPAIINLANIHYSRNEIAEAQALYERAIALQPEVVDAHFNLGSIFHDLGRYSDARIWYRVALQLNPTYADAHFCLAVRLKK